MDSPHLPYKAVLRAFKPLKFAAHAHPFVVVVVVLLFDAVQHQVSVLPLQIAKGGAEDGKFRVHKCELEAVAGGCAGDHGAGFGHAKPITGSAPNCRLTCSSTGTE